MLVCPVPTFVGNNHEIAANPAAPIAATAQNVQRQPAAWPNAVPPGTPRMLATVRPDRASETAEARRLSGTMLAAKTEPRPKKEPWHNELMTRAPANRPKHGATAQ